MTKEEVINKAIELEFGAGNIQGIRAHNSSLVKVAEHLYDLLRPSLPSNLDEAANDGWALYEYRESPKGLYSTCYIDGFKAGAEWLAGQFQKIDGSLDDWYETNGVEYCSGIRANESFEVPEGFYIRKK